MVIDEQGFVNYDDADNYIFHLRKYAEQHSDACVRLDESDTNGRYVRRTNMIEIGAEEWLKSSKNKKMHIVNLISMHKQCFHELRHWYQYNCMFKKSEFGGLDEYIVRHMARQAMVSDVFPDYVGNSFWYISDTVKNNYYNMGMEIDAERYAIESVREYFSDEMDSVCLDACIMSEVSRRLDWWGDKYGKSLDNMLMDLQNKLRDCISLSLDEKTLNVAIDKHPIRDLFRNDEQKVSQYFGLPVKERDAFLVNHVYRNGNFHAKLYPVISDEFPKLTFFQKLDKSVHMLKDGRADENDYDLC